MAVGHEPSRDLNDITIDLHGRAQRHFPFRDGRSLATARADALGGRRRTAAS